MRKYEGVLINQGDIKTGKGAKSGQKNGVPFKGGSFRMCRIVGFLG